MALDKDQDKDIRDYFTATDQIEAILEDIQSQVPSQRILAIQGPTSIGKSWLLRKIRVCCKDNHIPVALVKGDLILEVVKVLSEWTNDLSIPLDSYKKIYQAHLDIKKTVFESGIKIFGMAFTLNQPSTMDWLKGNYLESEIELLLTPEIKLTEAFLKDLEAYHQKVVLLFDTYEKISGSTNKWLCDLTRQLPQNAYIVIAGQKFPDWDVSSPSHSELWSGWQTNAERKNLKPMNNKDIRNVIGKYVEISMKDKPKPDVDNVEAIVNFAGGLPIIASGAVQLWNNPTFQGNLPAIKRGTIDNFVKILMESMPKDLATIVKAASIVRWFDEPILRTVTGLQDVSEAYDRITRYSFFQPLENGYALHDSFRKLIEEELKLRDPERYHLLHKRAADYFESKLNQTQNQPVERMELENIYHRVQADETTGILVFQAKAEEIVRFRFINRLRILLEDTKSYSLKREISKLWINYYLARLLHLVGQPIEAETVYRRIAEAKLDEQKLQAYAWNDLGSILRGKRISRPDILAEMINCFEQSLSKGVLDYKLASGFLELMGIYRDKGEWDRALDNLNHALDYYSNQNSLYDLAVVFNRFRWYYIYRGDWKQSFASEKTGLEFAHQLKNPLFLQRELSVSPAEIWDGRYFEGEQSIRQVIDWDEELGIGSTTGNLAIVLGLEDKFDEAIADIIKNQESVSYARVYSERSEAVGLGWYGIILVRSGEAGKGLEKLLESAQIKRKIEDTSYLLETINWIGITNEILGRWDQAEISYKQNTEEYKWTGRLYFYCGALTGLARVRFEKGEYSAVIPPLVEVEILAQQYEYNDYLASLRLTQAMVIYKTVANAYDDILRCFKQSMIYALRYNRFLLDEVLSGRKEGTPLRAIVPNCMQFGDEGRRILIALRDWWKNGINDIGASRPDTISPITEGISLIEAEIIARKREPGNCSYQKTVIEQIEDAIR